MQTLHYQSVVAPLLTLAFMCLTDSAGAQNPIICDRYTPDPAPYAHGDTLYLFVDHDEDVTENNYFTMKDWLLYSTVDMVNWTYRGTPMSSATFSRWAKQGNDCWAAQCIERNGRWYWYTTATIAGQAYPGIGVAYATSPAGPYHSLSKPLVQGWFYIDPSVFIDDDGQAYLFWGNNGLWYAPLGSNMLSIKGTPIKVNTNDESAFGPYKGYDDNGNPKTNFEEASWVYKIGDTYYLEYAAGGVPEHMAYSTATNIKGPWTYRGKIMGQAEGSFTIHGGSVRFKGHEYMFYHNGRLPGGGGYKRSTCVEEFHRNADGSIPYIPFTSKGVDPIETLNPYIRQEAETINHSSGILCVGSYQRCWVSKIHSGDYIKVRNVDFGSVGADRFTACVASSTRANLIIRLDSNTDRTVGVVRIDDTGGEEEWQTLETTLTRTITGVHDVYFTFSGTTTGTTLFNFDSWQFCEVGSAVNNIQVDANAKTICTISGIEVSPTFKAQRPGIYIDGGRKVLITR